MSCRAPQPLSNYSIKRPDPSPAPPSPVIEVPVVKQMVFQFKEPVELKFQCIKPVKLV